MLIELLLILLILPLYVGIFCIFFRFRYLIKAMTDIENIMCDLMSDDSEEINKRGFLIGKVENGESISNTKTPWTKERLKKASDKVIERLYANHIKKAEKNLNKDLTSRFLCLDNVESVKKGLSSNFLIKKQAISKGVELPVIQNTPMEIIGSYVYEKCGNGLLASIAYFTTFFNHFDWETCARIADKRIAAKNYEEEEDLQDLDAS